MITIIFGAIIAVICLIGLLNAKGAFGGIFYGPGFFIGIAIIIVGSVDKFLIN